MLHPLDSLRIRLGAKKRRADANFGCAFLNGGFKVVRHPHRKHRQAPAQSRFEGITQMSKPREIRTHFLRVLQIRRDAHESGQTQFFELHDSFGEGGKFTFGRATFRFLTAEMHLN